MYVVAAVAVVICREASNLRALQLAVMVTAAVLA
jgi:hypothetical protein